MSTIWPRERSMPLATFWFTAMSSTTKIRRAVSASCTLAACSASAGASATCNGISNQKVLPVPGVLMTPIAPPIASISRLEIASPKPVPPKRRLMLASPCENSLNSRPLAESGMPIPVSVTANRRRGSPLSWLPPTRRRTEPWGVNLTALLNRLSRTWRMRFFVAAHEWRQVRIELERELQAFGLRAPQAHPDRGIHQASQAERHLLDFHHPGLELGEAQGVVDDAQQGIAATADRLHALDLLRAQRASPQQRRHAQHAVEWRSDP